MNAQIAVRNRVRVKWKRQYLSQNKEVMSFAGGSNVGRRSCINVVC